MKNIYPLLILVFIFLISCQKKEFEEMVENNNDPEPVESMDDLIATETFDWQTTKEIELFIEGLPSPYPNATTLLVSASNGQTVYKKLVQINESFSVLLTVPSYETSLKIDCKGLKETIAIENGEAYFSFIPNLSAK